MNKILKEAASLTVITVIIGLLLGVVYEVTKAPIAKQEEKTRTDAWEEVSPNAASFKNLDISGQEKAIRKALDAAGFQSETVDGAAKAYDESGNPAGYVITVTSKEGYKGDIQLTMGVGEDGTTGGISFIHIDETAGLGMNANTKDFKDQFKDKQVTSFHYSKTTSQSEDEIDAISGATITTNAVTNGVNAGLVVFQLIKEGGIEF